MKFFSYSIAILPLVTAIVIDTRDLQTQETTDAAKRDLQPIDGDITLIARDNEQDDTERSDADENWGLVERADVPGLKCGGTRAVRCGLTAGGALATCFFAGVAKGKDTKENTKCAAALGAYGANLPRDCNLCFGRPINV